MNPLLATFKYSRKKLLDMYAQFAKDHNTDFLVTTKPVHSVQSLQGDVVNVNASVPYAYLVFRRGQTMMFFEPALGQSAPLSGDPNHRFSEADTTLTKPRSTPGAADMAIEGLGFELRGIKPVYPDATNFFPPAQTVDPAVAAALAGTGPIYDPGSKIIPVELSSPAMLEQTLLSALSPYLVLSFEWDQAERTEKIGTANQLGVGGGSSYLHANGVPSSRDRYEIPEGYIWSRDGEPGSEFVCRTTLVENVVIPITPVSELEASAFEAPNQIHAEFMLRAFGIQLRMPNKN
jgi:hypothetical protein